MAKGNLFMGTATGKVGSVVLYRRNGTQVSRAKVEKVSNPQSVAQMLNRVVISSVGKAYAFFSPLSDHGFQGYAGAAANMRRFQVVNNVRLGGRAREAFKNDTMDSVAAYAAKNTLGAPVNNYVIAEGDLPSASYSVSGVVTDGIMLNVGTSTPTYQDVIDASMLKVGDQLTFVLATAVGEEFSRLYHARVILQPANGDLSTPFLVDGKINQPNVKNEGTDLLKFTQAVQGTILNVTMASIREGETYAGGCLIVSRYEEGKWRRSQEEFQAVVSGPIELTLQAAIDSWTKSPTSSLYLNQGNETFTAG